MTSLYIKASKFLSYILRHNPDKFGIKLDSQGYADLKKILKILNKKFHEGSIDIQFLKEMIRKSNKKRFEITKNQIRALYGHSIPMKISLPEAKDPPEYLFHGTTQKFYDKIQKEGLKSQGRQYVHLSKDIETAQMVGKRRTQNPIILKIDVKNASKEGIHFYKSGELYLADRIPPEYITKFSS
jgi:putative RNA 2'-phosphotransferase